MNHSSLGSELGRKARGDLRLAIRWLLVGAFLAPAAHAQQAPVAGMTPSDQQKPTELAAVQVVGVRLPQMTPVPMNVYSPWGVTFWLDGMRMDSFLGPYDSGSGSDPQPEPSPQPNPQPDCKTIVNNPVSVVNGLKYDEVEEFQSLSTSELRFVRIRNPEWKGRGILGQQWITNFDRKISFTDTYTSCYPTPGSSCSVSNPKSITYYTDQGGVVVLTPVNGVWVGEDSTSHYRIVKINDGSVDDGKFRLTISGDSPFSPRMVFRKNGFIDYVDERDGNRLTYGYDTSNRLTSVTHTSGRKITLSWTGGTGTTVASITAPNGGIYRFGYYTQGTEYASGNTAPILRTVAYPDNKGNLEYVHKTGTHTIFGDPRPYTHAHQLQEIRLNGQPWKKYTYGTYGDAVYTSQFADGTDKYDYVSGGSSTVVYDENNVPTWDRVVINPYGMKTTYTIRGRNIIEVSGEATMHCGATFASASYDDDGRLRSTVDENEVITTYDYDVHGRETQKIEAAGTPQQRTTTRVWDVASPTNPRGTEQLRSVTIEGLRRTTFTYTTADLNRASLYETITERNLTGNGVANQDRTTTFSYTFHPSGLIASVTEDGPLAGTGDRVVRRYNALGDLVSIENSLGHTRTFSGHNAFGQPARVVNENGDATDFTYDVRGRIETETTWYNGVAKTTRRYYDAFGRMYRIAKPYGRATELTYDSAGRVTGRYEQVAPGKYGFETYEYDVASNIVKTESGESTYVPGTSVVGYIDAVDAVAGGYEVSGWACAKMMVDSIDVHVYVGGGAGIGTFVGAVKANRGSEPAVATACQSVGTAYRYKFALTDAIRQAHGGKAIYVHGIAPANSGAANLLLNNSGAFAVPLASGATAVVAPTAKASCTSPCTTLSTKPRATIAGAPTGATVTRRVITDRDERGRIRAVRGNNGQSTTITYDAVGNVATETDALQRTTTRTYDALGRPAEVHDAMGGVTRYEYDAAGKPKRIVDPRGNATTYAFDGFGNLWRQVSPDSGVTTFAYNVAGLMTSQTLANGKTTTFGYDALGRMISRDAGGLVHTFTFDACTNGKGRMCTVTDPHGVQSYTYTPQGQKLTQGQTITGSSLDFGQAFAYDDLGRLTGISYPGGVSVGYGYLLDRVTAVTAVIGGTNYNVATGIGYQAFGPVTGWTYGNGTTRDLTYDQNYAAGDRRPTVIRTMNGGITLQRLVRTYDVADQATRTQDYVTPNASLDFTYDALGRLAIEARTGATSSYYTGYYYDPNGNRTSIKRRVGATIFPNQIYGVDVASNRLLSVNGGTFSYDPNGNTTFNPLGAGGTYSYDPFNRLNKVENGGVTSNYWINALGQRVRKDRGTTATTQAFVYGLGDEVEAEFNWGTNSWTHYLRLGGEPIAMVRGGALNMIHTDFQGRPEIVTNASRSVVWRATNTAFDRSVVADAIGGLNLGFPGQYWDAESGLWYNRFRSYAPALGRYVESDPLGLVAGTNTYAYVGSNPVKRTDPSGLACNDLGCWNTPAELGYANAGNYGLYYQAACSGGDSYACAARVIATGEATSMTSGMGAMFTNGNLRQALRKGGSKCVEKDMESIRVELMNARVAQLAGATSASPVVVSRESISQFHRDIFESHGATDGVLFTPVFGGDNVYFGIDFGNRAGWTWCSAPACQE